MKSNQSTHQRIIRMDIVLQTNTICMKKILGFLTAQKAKLQQQINNGSITSPWWCSVVLYAKGPSNKESGIDS
jgi:hypothetical protein